MQNPDPELVKLVKWDARIKARVREAKVIFEQLVPVGPGGVLGKLTKVNFLCDSPVVPGHMSDGMFRWLDRRRQQQVTFVDVLRMLMPHTSYRDLEVYATMAYQDPPRPVEKPEFTKEQRREVDDLFASMDGDGDGFLTRHDIDHFLDYVCMTRDDEEALFNADGLLTFEVFSEHMQDAYTMEPVSTPKIKPPKVPVDEDFTPELVSKASLIGTTRVPPLGRTLTEGFPSIFEPGDWNYG